MAGQSMTRFAEFVVKESALAWFGERGWSILHGLGAAMGDFS